MLYSLSSVAKILVDGCSFDASRRSRFDPPRRSSFDPDPSKGSSFRPAKAV